MLVNPWEVGLSVAVRFGTAFTESRPPLSGIVRVVRSQHSWGNEPRVVIEVEVPGRGVYELDLADPNIDHIQVNSEDRVPQLVRLDSQRPNEKAK